MRKTYAIKIERRTQRAQYLPGYPTKEEAEKALAEMDKEPEAKYSVVYVKEYFNRGKDKNGNPKSTIAEI